MGVIDIWNKSKELLSKATSIPEKKYTKVDNALEDIKLFSSLISTGENFYIQHQLTTAIRAAYTLGATEEQVDASFPQTPLQTLIDQLLSDRPND